jgi:hypothetical protein
MKAPAVNPDHQRRLVDAIGDMKIKSERAESKQPRIYQLRVDHMDTIARGSSK